MSGECFHFEITVRYFLAVNVQTHPAVNVAIHLDNVQCLDNCMNHTMF